MWRDLRIGLSWGNVHSISRNLNLRNLSFLCFYLTALTTQLHAKMEPKRFVDEDRQTQILFFSLKERTEQGKEYRRLERKKEISDYELWPPLIFPIKVYFMYSTNLFLVWEFALKPVYYHSISLLNNERHLFHKSFIRARFPFSRTVQTHLIWINTVDLAKLLEHPLRSPNKWRRAFKLLDLCNRCLSWFLVCH